ncbi:hypothetical protein [Klebsiella pneumoniae]
MAHDVPLGCAPDEYDDLISGTCSHLPYATVYLNGERVAKLDPKEKATFYLSEGEWAVGANLEGKGLCSLNRERQERFFNIKAGEKKAARVFTDANGDLDIRPTTIN